MSIKLRDYFYKKTSVNMINAFQNLFKPKSTFVPTDKLSPEAIKAVQAISDYTAQLIKGRLIKMATHHWDNWFAYRLCELIFLKPRHVRSLS